MRHDIGKVLTERQRRGSREGSLRTALKLNANLDYDSGDLDWGPVYVSSARHRQEGQGRSHKSLNHNTRALHQFLGKNVGRPWNDVFSEICVHADNRSTLGYNIRHNIEWMVSTTVHMVDGLPYTSRWSWHEYTGYYVHPETGLLCEQERHRYRRRKESITSLHWYGNVWFQLVTLKTHAKCGCVHFKVPPDEEKLPRWRYRNSDLGPAVCIHGNEPISRPIWYVIEYAYHDPDEVFKVHRLSDYRRLDGSLSPGYERYGLSTSNPVVYVYYRDVPKTLETPITISKRVANRKELKLIREALEADENSASSLCIGPPPPKNDKDRIRYSF